MSFHPPVWSLKTIKRLHVKYDAVIASVHLSSLWAWVVPEQSIAELLMGLELLLAKALRNSVVQLHFLCVCYCSQRMHAALPPASVRFNPKRLHDQSEPPVQSHTKLTALTHSRQLADTQSGSSHILSIHP